MFLEHLLVNCKRNHYLYGKSWFLMLLKCNNNFRNNQIKNKKILHPLLLPPSPIKKAVVVGKSQKIMLYIFRYKQTQLFSQLWLFKNRLFCREKHEALLTENRDNFSFSIQFSIFQTSSTNVKCNNIPSKWSFNHVFCPTNISEGCHKSGLTVVKWSSYLTQIYLTFVF